jgi:hypothetical protein
MTTIWRVTQTGNACVKMASWLGRSSSSINAITWRTYGV